MILSFESKIKSNDLSSLKTLNNFLTCVVKKINKKEEFKEPYFVHR
jgi:hypothetical protein